VDVLVDDGAGHSATTSGTLVVSGSGGSGSSGGSGASTPPTTPQVRPAADQLPQTGGSGTGPGAIALLLILCGLVLLGAGRAGSTDD
jgi:hypothetical protein